MWMWALRKVPWRTLIRHAPTIVTTAREVYAKTRPSSSERVIVRVPDHRVSGGLDAVRRRVDTLEERVEQEAKVVADVAQELERVATALAVVGARVTLALWGAGIAGALALAALLVALLRH